MQILICQSCGFIVRGKAKFCSGCGAHISKFSPTSLPALTEATAPLAVSVSPDPLALERTIVLSRVAHLNGGNGNGNGQYGGNGHHEEVPAGTSPPGANAPPAEPQQAQPPTGAAASVAEPAAAPYQAPPSPPASKLASLLGGAASPLARSGGAAASDILSLIEDQSPAEAEPTPPASLPTDQRHFQEPSAPASESYPVQPQFSEPYPPAQPLAYSPAPFAAPAAPAAPGMTDPAPSAPADPFIGQSAPPPLPAQPSFMPADPSSLRPPEPPSFQAQPPAMPAAEAQTPAGYEQAAAEPYRPDSEETADTSYDSMGAAPAAFASSFNYRPSAFSSFLKPGAGIGSLFAAVSAAGSYSSDDESSYQTAEPASAPPADSGVQPAYQAAPAPSSPPVDPGIQPGYQEPAAPPPPQPAQDYQAAPPLEADPLEALFPSGDLQMPDPFGGATTAAAGQPAQPWPQTPADTGPTEFYSESQALSEPSQEPTYDPSTYAQPAEAPQQATPAALPPVFKASSAPSQTSQFMSPVGGYTGLPLQPPTGFEPGVPGQGFSAPDAGEPAAHTAEMEAPPDPGTSTEVPPAGPPGQPAAAEFFSSAALPGSEALPPPAGTVLPFSPAVPPSAADSAVPRQPEFAFEPTPIPPAAGTESPSGPPQPQLPPDDFFSAAPQPAAPADAAAGDSTPFPPMEQPAPQPAPPPQAAQPASSPQAAGGMDFFSSAPAPTPGSAPAPSSGLSASPQWADSPTFSPPSTGEADFFGGAPAAPAAQDSPGQFATSAPPPVPGLDTPAAATEVDTASSLQPAALPVDEEGFPDESVNRGRGRESERDRAGDDAPSSGKKLRGISSSEASDDKPAKFGAGTPLEKVMALLEGEVEVMGRPIPKRQAAIVAAVLVVIGLQVLGQIAGLIGGALGGVKTAATQQQAAQGPSLSGYWNFAYEYKGQPLQGQMRLQQQGGQLVGEGRDQEYFQLSGTFDPQNGKIVFNKQYVQNQRAVGKPIVYQGTVELRPNGPYASGIYASQERVGVFYKARLQEVRGRWEAELAQAESGVGDDPSVASKVAEPADPRTGIQRQQEFFGKVAIGILMIGALLAMLSLKLFGPAGLINIWAKKEYIPSQFKSQHFKMVREFGKPLKPGGVPLGMREEWGPHQLHLPKELALPPEVRDQNPHMLVIGAGAKGKSRLMASMISHDIESDDRAVVVIDSDGGLIDLITRWIAAHSKGKEFAERVIIIDPTNKEGSAAYNPLEEPPDGDLQAAASSIVYGFKAIYTEPPGSQSQWNQQTANILRNAALLLMVNGKTLTDLPTLLSDNDFRDVLLEKVEKRKNEKVEFITLLDTWGQYKRLARTDQWINWVEPILNRVSPMLGDPRIRPILTKPKGDLNLREIITEKKILLVKVPEGQLDQNANLLGSLLVTGLKQAALSIATYGKSKRHPSALYLDEFDNFIEKETVEAFTSETKKFQIGLVGAVKTLQHMPEDFRSQLIINVGTVMAFALAKKDGDLLGPQMFRVDGRKVKHQTIQNIFNKVNTSPQFELISDEEKLNIDRVVGQEERTYFCYRVGTVAGVFNLKAPEFKDIPDKDVNWTLVDEMRGNTQAVQPDR